MYFSRRTIKLCCSTFLSSRASSSCASFDDRLKWSAPSSIGSSMDSNELFALKIGVIWGLPSVSDKFADGTRLRTFADMRFGDVFSPEEAKSR